MLSTCNLAYRGTLRYSWLKCAPHPPPYKSLDPTDPTKPNLYRFVDAPATPDPFYTEDYLTQHKGKETPIIVDNGTGRSRSIGADV